MKNSNKFNKPQKGKSLDRCRESITKWELARSEGSSNTLCQNYAGISRSTYYRYKKRIKNVEIFKSTRPYNVRKKQYTQSQVNLIVKIRKDSPTYGKFKIAVILKRDHGVTLSESTVGRIIKELIALNAIEISRSYKRKRSPQKRRPHAKAAEYKLYEEIEIGESVQIDHMTITKNGLKIKHFQAWDRVSKHIYGEIYSNAKSKTAKIFLENLIKKCPFKLLSVQVDGGSEFMGEFEQACKELGLPLFVLPPASPKQNGGVERGNRIFKEEFYADKSITCKSFAAMRYELKQALLKYNCYRPHFDLKGLTPMQYINNYILMNENTAA